MPWPFALSDGGSLFSIEKGDPNESFPWTLRKTSFDASRAIRETSLPPLDTDNSYFALHLLDARKLALAVAGGQFSLIDTQNWKIVNTIKIDGSIVDISISRSQNAVAILTDKEIIVLDTTSNLIIYRQTLPKIFAGGSDFSFSLDASGTTAYFVGGGALYTLKLKTGKLTRTLLTSKDAVAAQTSVGTLTVLPSGTQLLAGGQPTSIAPEGQVPRLIDIKSGAVNDLLGSSSGPMISSTATDGFIIANPEVKIYQPDLGYSDRYEPMGRPLPLYINGVAATPSRCEANKNISIIACTIDRPGEQRLIVITLQSGQANFLRISKLRMETGGIDPGSIENLFMYNHGGGYSNSSQELIKLHPPEHLESFQSGSKRSAELGFPGGTAVYESAENGLRYIGNCSGQVIAVSNSGDRLWTTDRRTTEEADSCSLRTTGYVGSISPSASGRYLYVSIYNQSDLLILDTDTGRLLASIQGDGWPFYVQALSRDIVGVVWGNAGTDTTTPDLAVAYLIPEQPSDLVNLARDRSVFARGTD